MFFIQRADNNQLNSYLFYFTDAEETIVAKPIELGLVLEGEDAREFWENEKKPATKQQIEMFKRARKLASTVRL
jgi:hypothetical protein